MNKALRIAEPPISLLKYIYALLVLAEVILSSQNFCKRTLSYSDVYKTGTPWKQTVV
jgi:hypothetical protein